MRGLLRAYDWSAFPGGAPSSWPGAIKTALQLILDSNQPASLAWEADLHFFYNDAYIELLDGKHPSALTRPFREVWPEYWQEFEPVIRRALAGEPSFHVNRPFHRRCHGHEETWLTYSLTAIRDECGNIVGIFNTVIETTRQVEAERRQTFELELVDRLRNLSSPESVMAAAIELLGQRLGVSRVLYAEVDSAKDTAFIRRDWVAEGVASLAGQTRTMSDFGPEMVDSLRAGMPVAVDDVALDARAARHLAAYESVGIRAMLLIPLPASSPLRVLLALHCATPHRWGSEEIQVAQDTGERTWTAVEASRAEAALLASATRNAFRISLADALRGLADPVEIQIVANRKLGEHLAANRVFYLEVEGEDFVFAGHFEHDVPHMTPGRHPASACGQRALETYRYGMPLVIQDIQADARFTPAEKKAYAEIQCRAAVGVPLIKQGRLAAVLCVHTAAARAWTADEIELVEDTADRAWETVERAKVEAKLREAEERYLALFNAIDQGFCTMELAFDANWKPVDYRYLEVSPSFERQTGIRNAAGRWMREIVPDHDQHWFDTYGRVALTGEPTRFENYSTPLGRWWSVYAFRIQDPSLRRVAALFHDITERKQAEEQIRHASLHDPLTGLPNRAMLFEYATHMLPRNRRADRCAAVLFLDLDRFKPINDTHGHEAGDAVLKEVAARLTERLRTEDIVIRLGGDEFIILLQEIKNRATAADLACQIASRISEPYLVGELALSLSTSIGISIFPADGQDIDTLISHADLAMYKAKQAGRNNFQFYSSEYSDESRQQSRIEEQLKSALRDSAFHLCYQPVLDAETGGVVSVEALLRCRNTDVGPDRFVPIAEATGMINPIGRWLLAEAVRQHKKWLRHGLPLIPIAVNVSVVEFRDKDFSDRFERTIREHGVDTNALQVELTETAVMDDVEHAVEALARLKALGVKILLDDFGTGHSSLAYLARLPLNKVKIDKSFVVPLDEDTISRAVTHAMIALSRTLDLEVVAEGVETRSALDYVRAHGCTQVQGYYFGQPMPGDVFEQWYRNIPPGFLGRWPDIPIP
ncbi:MAG TPA: EAL domain-containing protein [Paucimonas sp.]|nr:EAL domain-containing protein [Paucimonas sp.]